MAYVAVPKDLTKIKNKVLFNLTKRQLICFSGALIIGVPLFFLLHGKVSVSVATLCMMIVMLPLFLLAMYEKNGYPLERLAHQFIKVLFIRKTYRPYVTNNFYAVLKRQIQLEKEVRAIVKAKENSTIKKRKGTN